VIVRCISNDLKELDKKLTRFAFHQDESGVTDLTVGKEYKAYGKRKNKLGSFFFIVTDDDKLPWWMPAAFFEIEDENHPDNWVEEKFNARYGKASVLASPEYHASNSEDIEDGSLEGFRIFDKMKY
jgi:hypothetical protein